MLNKDHKTQQCVKRESIMKHLEDDDLLMAEETVCLLKK